MARPATPMVGRCMARRHGFALPRVARAGLDTASHCTIAPRLGAGRRRRRRASCDGTAERHDRIRPRARGNARRQTLQSRRPRALRYARARRRLVHPVQRAASGRPCRPSRGTGRAAAADASDPVPGRNVRRAADGSYYDYEYGKPIMIGSNCWFGGNVTVVGGVTIGEGCVIGAGSARPRHQILGQDLTANRYRGRPVQSSPV